MCAGQCYFQGGVIYPYTVEKNYCVSQKITLLDFTGLLSRNSRRVFFWDTITKGILGSKSCVQQQQQQIRVQRCFNIANQRHKQNREADFYKFYNPKLRCDQCQQNQSITKL